MTTRITTKKLATPDEIRQSALMSLANGQILLNKSYISELGHYPLQLLKAFPAEIINANTDVRIFKIERIVLENKQSALESLTAAYTALGSAGYSVFLLLKSDGKTTDIYLGIRGQAKKLSGIDAGKLLEQVFKGHFAGSQLTNVTGIDSLLYNLRHSNNAHHPSITAVTGVPSLSVEEREHFMQGLEHFIDAAEGQTYQALILASPISSPQLELIQRGYEGVATQISPLLKHSLSFGENESESVGLSIGDSISKSLGTSLSLTETKGTNESSTKTITHGTNESHTEGTSYSTSSQTTLSKVVTIAAPILGGAIGFAIAKQSGSAVGGLLANTIAGALSESESHGTNTSNTKGTSYSETDGKTTGTSFSKSEGKTINENQTNTISSNRSDTTTQGSSKQLTLEITDKSIEQLIKKIDHQIERVDEARRYGGWHSAAYFIAETSASSRALASIFLGLMRGHHSNSEDFSLTTWQNEKSAQVLSWLSNLSHPKVMADFSKALGIDYLTPATLVSGKEMAIQLSLPRRSTSTVSVVEAQAFGRQIQSVNGTLESTDKVVNLGKIRHLWQTLPQSVELDVQKLASHIFVTGSTGSGKSNTVYQILNELNRNKVKFMVIEPAKGEYKNVFGHRDDVKVFGTNPKKTALLRINPFKFPDDIHVLEHIDRLIEIFNVCWPMYAAMPAVLKDAMLEAYKASGWDLEHSYNRHPNLFPSFSDLLTQLKHVIDSSAFSQEVKSNYEGSLVTRVKSLTNGLNGQIFSSDEIDNHILFDENIIVDLSRIGSQETKSLIMGILIMRLNEYRMSESTGMNEPLKHVTVLEEAHNILKRTSTEQSSEGSNVAGKSVEMLSNAIAEMRTYGEGFIIADQSPSAVDISAIRNTNTKIIMRLPDEADRRLAGKASGVNEEQLEELAKLPKGVAVIYQNDWLEPVLCQIHKCDAEEKLFVQQEKSVLNTHIKKQFNSDLAELLFSQKFSPEKKLNFEKITKSIEKSNLPIEFKTYLNDALTQLENGVVVSLLQKDLGYLVDLYQRLIQDYLADVIHDLPTTLQKNLSTEKIM
ncbi:ATP-binding protein [Bisgaard Taxon 45]